MTKDIQKVLDREPQRRLSDRSMSGGLGPSGATGAQKCHSRVVSFEGCEIRTCADKVVVDSRVPLSDLPLWGFARPRLIFEGRSYYVAEKSQAFGMAMSPPSRRR